MCSINLFDRLPSEIVVLILDWLPVQEACRATATCKRFRALFYRYRAFSRLEAIDLYRSAISHEQLKFITGTLVHNPTLRPAANRNLLIRLACECRYTELVEHLLKSGTTYPGLDPGAESNWPLTLACRHNHIDVIKLLLKDPRVDPTARDDKALRVAYSHLARKCEYIPPTGPEDHSYCLDTVCLLMADGRVDPRSAGNILAVACRFGDIGLVKLLLADPRVDPMYEGNAPMEEALRAYPYQPEIANLLLSTGRVDPSFGPHSSVNDWLLSWLLKHGNTNLGKRMLSYPKVMSMYLAELAHPTVIREGVHNTH